MPKETRRELLRRAAAGVAAAGKGTAVAASAFDSRRNLVPRNWWESASGVVRVSLKKGARQVSFPLEPGKAAAELDRLKSLGFSAIEIYQAAYSGNAYGGLDPIDRYRIDPAAGSVDDFRAMVRQAHTKGMPVIMFENLGYIAAESPQWLKACDDVRAARDTREARWFLWSDKPDAPAPKGDNIFMLSSPMTVWRYGHAADEPGPDQRWLGLAMAKSGMWAYSERAGKYYWSKWQSRDASGKTQQLAHYNWANREWQEEAEKILRFWMDTGLDGIIMDAPNWYIDCGWEMTRRRITGVVSSYGNTYRQPEGAGVFFENPSVWITEGGYNSLQNYPLSGSKTGGGIIGAMETGDPRGIEKVLRPYHDRVVEAGGVLYFFPPRFKEVEKQRLSVATAALTGNLLAYRHADALNVDAYVQRLLKLKLKHPALQQRAARRSLPTNADDKHYAFLRTAADESERILVVMNFQLTAQTVEVDLSGVATARLVDLETGTASPRQVPFRVEVPAYDYRLYSVDLAARRGFDVTDRY